MGKELATKNFQILLTIGDISIGGGAERVVVNLAQALLEMGHKVEILSFYRTQENLPYHINPAIKLSFLHQESQKTMRKKPLYKLYYKIYESYLVNKMYPNADFIVFNNSPHYPFFKNKKTKYIKFVHSCFTRFLKRFRAFDVLVVLSGKEIETWRKYYKNIVVIPNFLSKIPQENATLANKRVLSVGRITPNDEKGFFRLVEIWEMVQQERGLNDWELHIICGAESEREQEYKEKLENKIKEKGLQDSIILKPFTKEIEKEYLQASIYAMASYWEGFGMVLVESASFGLPAIAFDIKTGPNDIIENKKSGFLIPDGDLKEYAKALWQLMSDYDLRAKMGVEAKRIVSEKFAKESVLEQWQKLFWNLSK